VTCIVTFRFCSTAQAIAPTEKAVYSLQQTLHIYLAVARHGHILALHGSTINVPGLAHKQRIGAK
jgi:hypothetical protein